jgi:hypothetical protein
MEERVLSQQRLMVQHQRVNFLTSSGRGTATREKSGQTLVWITSMIGASAKSNACHNHGQHTPHFPNTAASQLAQNTGLYQR